jgi:hypothetical protein
LQEFLGPLDAAGDDVLVQRQPGGRLELPREVVGVEADDCRQLRQARAAVEVFLDLLPHRAEPPPRQRGVPPALKAARCREVPEQVDGQDVGEGLGGKRAPGPAARQLSSHHGPRGTQGRQVQIIQRRDRQPCRVPVEYLGSDPTN